MTFDGWTCGWPKASFCASALTPTEQAKAKIQRTLPSEASHAPARQGTFDGRSAGTTSKSRAHAGWAGGHCHGGSGNGSRWNCPFFGGRKRSGSTEGSADSAAGSHIADKGILRPPRCIRVFVRLIRIRRIEVRSEVRAPNLWIPLRTPSHVSCTTSSATAFEYVHGREPENRGVIALDQRDEGNAWWHQV